MSLRPPLTQSWSILPYELAGIGVYFIFSFFLLIIFRFARRIYRLHLHPLRQFKGLPEACVSDDWLYKTTKGGVAEETFEGLHRKYNTRALRIGPNELHITDINLYKVIYSQTKPFLKHAPFYDGFNTPHTVFAETDPELHKERRRMLNPLFSKVGTYKLEPIIHEKIYLLSSKINRLLDSRSIDVYNAFRLMTTDIITQFAFSKSANLIEENDAYFDSWFLKAFDVGSQSIVETQYKPLLRFGSQVLPATVIKLMSPKVGYIFEVQEFAKSCLREWQNNPQHASHPVVFDSLRAIPDKHKVSEAIDILIAGADTTASTLTTGLYHILSNPEIKERLIQAIDDAMPESGSLVPLQTLEKVEYLRFSDALESLTNKQTACVKESIRVGMAVPGRLPRVVPSGDHFIVEGKIVPPGTIVGMSTYTMHTSADAWGPNARQFNPSRWLDPAAKGLEQWMCTFSKGARMCLGQNVAPAEITLTFAYIFRNYDLELGQGCATSKTLDRFTLQYENPGLPVVFRRRQAK